MQEWLCSSHNSLSSQTYVKSQKEAKTSKELYNRKKKMNHLCQNTTLPSKQTGSNIPINKLRQGISKVLLTISAVRGCKEWAPSLLSCGRPGMDRNPTDLFQGQKMVFFMSVCINCCFFLPFTPLVTCRWHYRWRNFFWVGWLPEELIQQGWAGGWTGRPLSCTFTSKWDCLHPELERNNCSFFFFLFFFHPP